MYELEELIDKYMDKFHINLPNAVNYIMEDLEEILAAAKEEGNEEEE